MGKTCLKCGYERTSGEIAPEYECPRCGAIYAKVEAALGKARPEEEGLANQHEPRTSRDRGGQLATTHTAKQQKGEGPTEESATPLHVRPRRMDIIMKFVAGLLGGFILAVLAAVLVTTTFAASPERGGSWGASALFMFWVIGIFIALGAKSAAKAWRRILLTSAVLSFLAPISAIIYTGSLIATTVDTTSEHASAQAAGAAVGGGLISGVYGFVGFFLGVVFLILGLLVGRDKQVVYVEREYHSAKER